MSTNKSPRNPQIHDLKRKELATMHTDYYGAMWHSAKNDRVYDSKGNSWIDFTAGIAVANSGHSNPTIISAIRAHLKEPLFTTYTFPHEPRLRLATTLIAFIQNSLGQQYIPHFVSSGAEAVEAAICVAKSAIPGKTKIIVSFINSFHGNTLLADTLSGTNEYAVFNFQDGEVCHYIKIPYHHRRQLYRKGEFIRSLEAALSKHSLSISDVNAVLVEPYQGKGVYVAHSQFMADIAEFCIKNCSFLVVDEVQSGFYRTGHRLASEYFTITPDVICLGKGLTSSLPMSAIAIHSKHRKHTTDLDIVTTHSANPLTCVAADANIQFLETTACQKRLSQNSPLFDSYMRDLLVSFPEHISYCETFGMLGSIHIVKNGVYDAKKAERITKECFKRGLLLSMPNGHFEAYLRFTPPLTIRKVSLEQAFKILKQVLAKEV